MTLSVTTHLLTHWIGRNMPKITFTFDQELFNQETAFNNSIIKGRLLPTGAEYEVDLWVGLSFLVIFSFIYPAFILCVFNLCGSCFDCCRKKRTAKQQMIRYQSATVATPTCLTPRNFSRFKNPIITDEETCYQGSYNRHLRLASDNTLWFTLWFTFWFV